MGQFTSGTTPLPNWVAQPNIWTNQLVGISESNPQRKLHITSIDEELVTHDFTASLALDYRHLRLRYIKRSNNNPMFLEPITLPSIVENSDWDIENSGSVLQFLFYDNLSASGTNPFSIFRDYARFNSNLEVWGNMSVTGTTALSSLTATDITTTNLSVLNQPTFHNGIKIKNSALQITDANNNVIWNFREDGKLGIGVSSSEMTGPYWLWVKNGIMTERLKVAVKNTADWKDYVFDKTYKLRSLDEVEAYIRANKHLPEIPSAEEVVRDGIDVQTMDAKLLQKIEELTLYVIELKKEINQLKKKK